MEQCNYIAIDLKSFYASVECVDKGMDPLNTNLVVADNSRTTKTICLAVSPSLKKYGISGRARLFEVVQKVKEINARRRVLNGGKDFSGASSFASDLDQDDTLELDYIVASPRMALYMDYSTRIYNIYLRYVAPEDVHVYSVDEVFIDAASYLHTYGMTAKELASQIILDVYQETKITATAGVGSNMYLCKVALDILAKHAKPDANGARIAQLDEMTYRRQLWHHQPLTDFWRVGAGISKKLQQHGMYTMGDVARCSIGKEGEYYNEELLYRLFGVNAQLLIDHAWGWEPCEMKHIKGYKPQTNSISSGQVLTAPYDTKKARIVLREMLDGLALDLTEKKLVTDQLVITVGYDVENLLDEKRRQAYKGEITVDRYGREVPKHGHGTQNLSYPTASANQIIQQGLALYDRIISPELLIRRFTISANHVITENQAKKYNEFQQMDLFSMGFVENKQEEKEKKLQEAVLQIKKKYGKNALLKGTNFEEGATARQRNDQIGGHKA